MGQKDEEVGLGDTFSQGGSALQFRVVEIWTVTDPKSIPWEAALTLGSKIEPGETIATLVSGDGAPYKDALTIRCWVPVSSLEKGERGWLRIGKEKTHGGRDGG